MSTKIQLYNSATDNIGTAIEIQNILQQISGKVGESAQLQQKIEKLRELIHEVNYWKTKQKDEPEQWEQYEKLIKKQQPLIDNLKCSLPAVTWSGTFTKREAKNLKEYSQLICLDIDKL